MNEERRRFTRIHFDGDAQLSQGSTRFPVNLLDISLNGALVATPEQYQLKTEADAELILTLTGDVVIKMSVRLAHSSSDCLGLRCTSIDMESMTHLRRLIELNMESPSACERVLDELVHHQEAAS